MFLRPLVSLSYDLLVRVLKKRFSNIPHLSYLSSYLVQVVVCSHRFMLQSFTSEQIIILFIYSQMPPVSKFTESERKKRKREAARLRQQRCRARKRERNHQNSSVMKFKKDIHMQNDRNRTLSSRLKKELNKTTAQDPQTSVVIKPIPSYPMTARGLDHDSDANQSPKVITMNLNAPATYLHHSRSPSSTLNFPQYCRSVPMTSSSSSWRSSDKSTGFLPLVPSLSSLEQKSAAINEIEKTAIHVMLSLRHSPVSNLSSNHSFTPISNFEM